MHSASSFYSKSNKLLDDNGPFLKEVTITTQEVLEKKKIFFFLLFFISNI